MTSTYCSRPLVGFEITCDSQQLTNLECYNIDNYQRVVQLGRRLRSVGSWQVSAVVSAEFADAYRVKLAELGIVEEK